MIDYQGLCSKVIQLDGSIRYVGIADHLGSLIAVEYRKGLDPLSSREETEKYTSKAIQTTGAIQGGSKVGGLRYVIGRYEHLIRATIPFVSERQDKFYLMLSLDPSSNVIGIIESQVRGVLPS